MNIMLVCAAGASSTVMAQSIRKAAKKKGMENVTCKAHSEYEMEGYLDEADVCLVGPHLKNQIESIKQVAKEYDVPAEVIPSEVYGELNGEKALEMALNLLNK